MSHLGEGGYSTEIPVFSFRPGRETADFRRAEALANRVTKLTGGEGLRESSGLSAISIVFALGTSNGLCPIDLLGEGLPDP